MKNFKVFKIKAIPLNTDLISGLLWNLDILGINETDDYLMVSVNEDSDITLLSLENILKKLADEKLLESFEITVELLENKNWNKEWESNTKIIEVGDKLVIKPSFKEFNSDVEKIIINIDPKMSFGTGEHQTTRIMLKLCESYISQGSKVLDVGSGTGVLAIAASKLGGSSVYAVDNDEWCFINASENIKNNNIQNIKLYQGTIEDIKDNDFDIVLANINKNVILEIKNSLVNALNESGILIISGVLASDLEQLNRQFTQEGLTAVKTEKCDEWLGVVFKKSG